MMTSNLARHNNVLVTCKTLLVFVLYHWLLILSIIPLSLLLLINLVELCKYNDKKFFLFTYFLSTYLQTGVTAKVKKCPHNTYVAFIDTNV